jgi:ribosomal-protein-alanine N-acetyltransferase
MTVENNAYAYFEKDGLYFLCEDGDIIGSGFENEINVVPALDKSFAYVIEETPEGKVLYLLEDGDLGSYCTVTTVLDEAQIINVATAERYKRQGCADAVISGVIDECKRRDIVSISLEVRESNAPAISLYEKFGFFVAGKRKNFYTNPRENALVMIKNLD